MKRFITLLVIAIVSCTIVNAEQRSTLKLVTPQMSQKMYRTIKAYPNITQLMYHLLDATTTLDGELKIEAISEHPDSAKNALNKLCEFLDNQGGDDYLTANLMQVFHFTAKETQLALSMYTDYAEEKAAILEQQELDAEQNRLTQWETNGKEFFDFSSDDDNLLRPRIDLFLDDVIAAIDSITANPSIVSDNDIAFINFTIIGPRQVENFSSTGTLGNVFAAENFKPAVSARYRFERLDTIVTVPCNVSFNVTEETEKLREVEVSIKYNKKKGTWKISSYDSYNKIKSEDIPLINRFLNSLPIDDPLRDNKHSLRIGIYKHWIKFNNRKFPLKYNLTNQCRIIRHLENKSFMERLSEAHIDL